MSEYDNRIFFRLYVFSHLLNIFSAARFPASSLSIIVIIVIAPDVSRSIFCLSPREEPNIATELCIPASSNLHTLPGLSTNITDPELLIKSLAYQKLYKY